MADTPEIIPPMKPGIDHPQHPELMRQVVAENAGESVTDVTPPDEVAGNIVDAARTDFLENVAGVKQPSDQTSGSQNTDSSDGLDNFKEAFNAFRPGGDDNAIARTIPSKGPYELESARKEKMTVEETK